MQLPARLGKYELLEFLGGGMSHVYRAYDTVIGRAVAVKILTEQGAQDPDARERFLTEARTAVKATHENVIAIHDFGSDEHMGLFMVMEFLQGEDLKSAIKNGHTGDLATKLKIALQTARALEYIHRNRIIHRDIKPENIHVTQAGVVKLMDFGIAKGEDLSRTQPGYVLGTPYYMAPEQVRGEPLTPQVDVYAFGVLLVELLTGQKVFVGDTVESIFYSILNVPVNLEPLRQAGLPQPLIELVAACNAKIPAERPQGFAPIVASLEHMIAGTGGQTRAAPPAPQSPQPPGSPPRKSLSRGILAAALGGLLLLGAGGYFLLKPGRTHQQAPQPATILSTTTGEMVLVPAGEFQFGQQKQRVSLPAFYIDKTEVTNAAYAGFCQAANRPLPEAFPTDKPHLPVVNITIHDAKDFAQWAGKRLPTDVEWEKAARGPDGWAFPWGNSMDASRANLGTDELRPVTDFAGGASPYGALQMVGNAWEFVDKIRNPPSDVRAFQSLKPPLRPDEAWYMIRGGSFAETPEDLVNVIWDSGAVPERWKGARLGFRCLKEAR